MPDFWIGDVKDLPQRFEHLKRGQMTVAAVTPGGRPMHLIAYGDREDVAHHANFNSAIGAQEPAAYMNKAARKKPASSSSAPCMATRWKVSRDWST